MTTTLLSVALGVVGMLGWGIYDFLGGVLSKRSGPLTTLFWSQAFGAVLILTVALVGAGWADVAPAWLFLCVIASGLYCAGYLFFFRGFEKGNVSIVAATMNLWAVFTMTVAFVAMGQRLTASQTVGAILILLGAMVASIDWVTVRRGGFQISLGVKETVAGAFFFGIYWNVSEVLAEHMGWLATTAIVKIGVVLTLVLVALCGKDKIAVAQLSVRTWCFLAAMGAVELGAVTAVNYGLTVGDAILISPIASALSVVTIALAVIVLGERISFLQWAGVAMAILGIVATAV